MKQKVLQTIHSLEHDWRELHQSKVYNNGNFDYRLIYEIINYEPACGEKGFNVAVYAVKTTKYTSKELLQKVRDCSGVDKVTIEDIFDYGLCARLDDMAATSIEDAREKLNLLMSQEWGYTSLFGFYMDKPQNMVGNNGWDFINGKIG